MISIGEMVDTSIVYSWITSVDNRLPDGYVPIGSLLANGKPVLFAIERKEIAQKDACGVPAASVSVLNNKGKRQYLEWGPVFTRLIMSNRDKFSVDFSLSDNDLSIIDTILNDHRRIAVEYQ